MTITSQPTAETTPDRPVVRADLEGAVTVPDFLRRRRHADPGRADG